MVSGVGIRQALIVSRRLNSDSKPGKVCEIGRDPLIKVGIGKKNLFHQGVSFRACGELLGVGRGKKKKQTLEGRRRAGGLQGGYLCFGCRDAKEGSGKILQYGLRSPFFCIPTTYAGAMSRIQRRIN